MPSFTTGRTIHILLLSLLLFAVLGLRYANPKPVERLRHIAFDAYNRMMPRPAGDEVVIIDIDEDSLRNYGQWPWPRNELGRMVEMLMDKGAGVVAFDIVFAEPDRTSPRFIVDRLKGEDIDPALSESIGKLPDNDAAFAESIRTSGRTVTAFVWTQQATERAPVMKAKIFNTGYKPDPAVFVTAVPHYATNLPILSEAAAGNGSFSMSPEQDGLIRRVPLLVGHQTASGVDVYPALSLEAIRVGLDKKIIKVKSIGTPTDEGYGIQSIEIGDYTVPTDSQGQFWVYYSGHNPARYIPAWKILSDQFDIADVAGKIVLVGTSAIGLLDLRSTPLNSIVPGVEVHAEIIEQIINGQFLQRPDYFDGAEILFTAAVGLMIIFLAPFVGTLPLAVFLSSLIFSGFCFSIFAFQHLGFLVDAIYPAMTVIVIFILASILTNLRSEAERRMIKNAFGHYISKDLMNELTADPDKLQLGGEVRNLTIMFTDVRNFTTISEALSPEELIQLMNDFLTPMTSIVMDQRGTVDKYMGDAMMAFWNAPLNVPEHARHGCQAALRMAGALEPINQALKNRAAAEKAEYHELRIGIGLATGACSVGNMGAKQRFAYSALGDSVNLASRLEGQTKTYGVSILVDEKTRQEAGDMAFLELDLIKVKGKTRPVRVFALIGDSRKAQIEAFSDLTKNHNEMLAAYRMQDFRKAADIAENLKKHSQGAQISGFYDLMIERCYLYMKTPPPAGWSGIYTTADK